MFQSKQVVVFLTKGVLHVTVVKKGARPAIVKTLRVEWNRERLPRIFSQIRESLHASTVRILLPDEFSYLLELTIPPSVSLYQERGFIAEQLTTHIPEVLHSNDWDFKETGKKNGQKRVLIFAPVKYVYDALLKAAETSGLGIEAMEPVTVAGKRHKNPVIGLALKKDIKGRDEQVLNIIPQEEEYESTTDDAGRKPFPVLTVIIAISALLLLGGGAAIFFLQQKPSQPTASPVLSPTPEPTSSIEKTPTPEPTEPVTLDKSILRVRVLNGTGKAGSSSAVRDLLLGQGFSDVETGNADSYDYEITYVRKKEEVPAIIYEDLSVLLSNYQLEESDPLTTSEPFDLLIIVGEINE